MEIRANAISFKKNPVSLVGPALKVGDKAPDFQCLEVLTVVRLADTPAKPRLFSVVPSLDTAVCSLQTRKLDVALAGLGDKVAAYTVSLDLPFAQKRFCSDAAAPIANFKTLSDVRNHSFGINYGVLIEGLPLPLLARSVFVVDAAGIIQYVEIVPEVTEEPKYDPAIEVLKSLAG